MNFIIFLLAGYTSCNCLADPLPLFTGSLTDVKDKSKECQVSGDPIISCQQGQVNFKALQSGSDLLFPNGKVLSFNGSEEIGEYTSSTYKVP